MALLRQFLKTGQLGPLVLGCSPLDVEQHLGPAPDRSRKVNPLILKYGWLELVFSNAPKRPPLLSQLTIKVDDGPVLLPATLDFDDFLLSPNESPTNFKSFLHENGLSPETVIEADPHTDILMPSGVRVRFDRSRLNSFHQSRRLSETNRAPLLTDEREPSLQQIRQLLSEADNAKRVGLINASFVLAWSALEASLRRLAIQSGLKGKITVQPSAMFHELLASGRLTSWQVAMLEELRQRRSAIVHGLISPQVDDEAVTRVVEIANMALGAADKIAETE